LTNCREVARDLHGISVSDFHFAGRP
jgi:hypothetical protein